MSKEKEAAQKLSKQIDQYLQYWDYNLTQLHQLMPRESRSRELNDAIWRIGRIMAISGKSNKEKSVQKIFDWDSRGFSNRILSNKDGAPSREREFLNQAFDADHVEKALVMLRVLNMIEHEMPLIHYTLMLRTWIEESDITVSGYLQDQKQDAQAMKTLTKKFKKASEMRVLTDGLFKAYWIHEHRKVLRERVGKIQQELQETEHVMRGCLENERLIDQHTSKISGELKRTLEQMQIRFNELLAKEDRVGIVKTEKTLQAEAGKSRTFYETFKDTVSFTKSPDKPLSASEVKSFQKSEKYPETKEFMQRSIGRVFSNYSVMIAVMDKFKRRNNEREVAAEKISAWKRMVEKSIGEILQDDESKAKLERWYYVSMQREVQCITIAQTGLQVSIQKFIAGNLYSFTDGLCQEANSDTPFKEALDRLEPKKINQYHLRWRDYKVKTKSRRRGFKIINRILMFMMACGLGYIAGSGLAFYMPAVWTAKISGFASGLLGGISVPAGLALAVPVGCLALGIMVVVQIRNAKAIRNEFEQSMARGLNCAQESDQRVSGSQSSYGSMLSRALRNCFSIKARRTPVHIDEYEEQEIDLNAVPAVVVTVLPERVEEESVSAEEAVTAAGEQALSTMGMFAEEEGRKSEFPALLSDAEVMDDVPLHSCSEDEDENRLRLTI